MEGGKRLRKAKYRNGYKQKKRKRIFCGRRKHEVLKSRASLVHWSESSEMDPEIKSSPKETEVTLQRSFPQPGCSHWEDETFLRKRTVTVPIDTSLIIDEGDAWKGRLRNKKKENLEETAVDSADQPGPSCSAVAETTPIIHEDWSSSYVAEGYGHEINTSLNEPSAVERSERTSEEEGELEEDSFNATSSIDEPPQQRKKSAAQKCKEYRERKKRRAEESAITINAPPILPEDASSMEYQSDNSARIDILCRLCLTELSACNYIFEFNDVLQFNVGDAITDLLGMTLNPEDGYPEKICDSCLQEVVHFRRFKGKCFESKAKLKEIVGERTGFLGTIKRESNDDLFEAVENEISGVKVKCEIEEDYGSENDEIDEVPPRMDVPNEFREVRRRRRKRRKPSDECESSGEGDSPVPSDPGQPCFDRGNIESGTLRKPEITGMLIVKNRGIYYSEPPFVSSVGVRESQDERLTVSPGMCSSSVNPKKSKCDRAPSLENPIVDDSLVTVKQEEISDEESCIEQTGYLSAS